MEVEPWRTQKQRGSSDAHQYGPSDLAALSSREILRLAYQKAERAVQLDLELDYPAACKLYRSTIKYLKIVSKRAAETANQGQANNTDFHHAERVDVLPVEASKLCKTFGSLVAVQDVSINIHKDEIHAVIGPNGAGKSTLISQICGSLSSDKGSVFLLGKDITNLPTEKRASLGIGRTFQISALAKEATVLENAILGSVGPSSMRQQTLE